MDRDKCKLQKILSRNGRKLTMPFAKKEFQYIQYTGDNLVQVLLFIRARGHKEKNITTYQNWYEGNVDVGIRVNDLQGPNLFTTTVGDYLMYDDEFEHIHITSQGDFEKHYTPIEESDVF